MDRYKSFAFFSAILAFFGNIWYFYDDFEFNPATYSLANPPALDGSLASNNYLRNAQLLLKGLVRGPESLLVENVTIYTGTWDGKLLKIVNLVVEKEITFVPEAKNCGLFDTEPICGRPLGIRRLDSQRIVVADAYFGIFVVDFSNGTFKNIFNPKKWAYNEKPMFINDLDILDQNSIFFTDSSSGWDRRRFLHSFLEHRSDGRVFHLDLQSGKVEIVLSGLHFANGIQILRDRQSFIVSECTMARIVRYYFAGHKKGERQLFSENLPGFPDNIRRSFAGNSYYVGLAGVRHSEEISLVDWLGQYPFLRKIIVKLIPSKFLARIFTYIKPKYGFVVELDESGNIIRSFQDPGGVVVPDVSQASDDETHLYLGSFHSDFIAKIPKKGLN